MTKFNYSILFVLVLFFLLNSCGKYEDGPAISFVSKENRLSRTWTLDNMEHSNGYTTNEYYFKLTFEKNKSLKIEHKNKSDELVLTNSTWEWLLGNYGLNLNLGYHPQGLPSGTVSFEIKKLTKKELWIQDRASLIMYHFKSE